MKHYLIKRRGSTMTCLGKLMDQMGAMEEGDPGDLSSTLTTFSKILMKHSKLIRMAITSTISNSINVHKTASSTLTTFLKKMMTCLDLISLVIWNLGLIPIGSIIITLTLGNPMNILLDIMHSTKPTMPMPTVPSTSTSTMPITKLSSMPICTNMSIHPILVKKVSHVAQLHSVLATWSRRIQYAPNPSWKLDIVPCAVLIYANEDCVQGQFFQASVQHEAHRQFVFRQFLSSFLPRVFHSHKLGSVCKNCCVCAETRENKTFTNISKISVWG